MPYFDNTAIFYIENYYAKIKEYLNFSIRELKYIYEILELY